MRCLCFLLAAPFLANAQDWPVYGGDRQGHTLFASQAD